MSHFFFDQLATFNPYYARFAPDATTPLINLTAAIDATFFTLWIGNNDVLGYALAGGASDSLTPPAMFSQLYGMILNACILNQDGAYDDAKGAVANIPDVLSIPYVTYMSTQVPYNGMVLTQEQAAGLNTLYQMYGHPEITFEAGQNAWVVENSDGTWGRMTANDLLLLSLPTDSMKCHGMGVANPAIPAPFPIPHKYILDAAEIADIRNHIDQYNATIHDLATMHNLALVDLNQVLEEAKTGIIVDGIEFTSTFIQGNVFSTDGIHLCPLGNALVAWYFIEAINATYGASIPQVNVTDYNGVQFP